MCVVTIEPFAERHKLVYDGFSRFVVLYCSQNTVKSINIQQYLGFKVQSSTSQNFREVEKLKLFFDVSAIMDQSACCYE